MNVIEIRLGLQQRLRETERDERISTEKKERFPFQYFFMFCFRFLA